MEEQLLVRTSILLAMDGPRFGLWGFVGLYISKHGTQFPCAFKKGLIMMFLNWGLHSPVCQAAQSMIS